MDILEHEGLCVPMGCITAVQHKECMVEIFTAFIGHRLSFDTEEEANKFYIKLRDDIKRF